MFGKLNSIALLVRANKADATFEKAMVVAQKAKAAGARQRILATQMENEEQAVRLEREAISAESLANQSCNAFQLAVGERNIAESKTKAAEENVRRAKAYCEQCNAKFYAAVNIAKVARADVPVAGNESAE